MARAAVLAFAVCCILVAPATARRPVDLQREVSIAVDNREAAAAKLLAEHVQVADAEATAVAVPEQVSNSVAVPEEEEGPVPEERQKHQHRSSLLCLVLRCRGGGAEQAGASSVAMTRRSIQEREALDVWAQPAVAGTAEEEEEVHGEEKGAAYDSESDWDTDSDSDDEDEGGILGWFWRLADAF